MSQTEELVKSLMRYTNRFHIEADVVNSSGAHQSFDGFVKRMRSFDKINGGWDYAAAASVEETEAAEKAFDAGSVVVLYSINLRFSIKYKEKDYWRSESKAWAGVHVEGFSLESMLLRAKEELDLVESGEHSFYVEKYNKGYSITARH